jgi:hypothetical protein
MGTTYYPVFLLPLWCSFYWERGIRRFAVGVAVALALLVAALWWKTADPTAFAGQLRQMFGWIFPNEVSLEGFWALPFNDSVFRLPVLAAFVAMISTLAIWPAPKNLGTLMSCTAAVLLGSQFWKAHNGGLFMAWFLPVLLLVIFRPNLENRVATLVPDATPALAAVGDRPRRLTITRVCHPRLGSKSGGNWRLACHARQAAVFQSKFSPVIFTSASSTR